MKHQRHFWKAGINSETGFALLAEYGSQPGYFAQGPDGSVRPLTATESAAVVDKLGEAPKRLIPPSCSPKHNTGLRERVAQAMGYEKRTSSATDKGRYTAHDF
ncbi:MAG: hypothetical protein AAFP98_01395 [Pseudomonadota bacterium]